MAAFWKLERLWRCPTISTSTKIKLFNTTCVTVLLYGCESWVLSKAMESEINAFGTSCYRIMLNIKRIDRVSNAKIYDLTHTAPLVENVRTRQLRFLGHVLRIPDDEPCKEYALYSKYAFLIFLWRNIMGFLRPKYFFFERVFFSLSNEV